LSARNNICLFASYFTGKSIPYYVRVYLKELKEHVKELVFLNDHSDLDPESLQFLKDNQITLQIEKNEGFDFGVWYKAFQSRDLSTFDHVLLVNDSCVLFRSLDPFFKWAEKDDSDVKGMTYSEAVTPHVQSYFMLLNKKAVNLASAYFNEHGIKSDIREVIRTYELGLNKHFTDNDLKLSSFVNNNGYNGEFSPYYKCVDLHLQQGIPLIKKKILFVSYRKDELPNLARMGLNIDADHYYSKIKENTDLVIDPDRLQREDPPQMSSSEIGVFNFKRSLIKLFRPLYKVFKK
jgi:lipopolysaccharide biosynthesis protein